MYVCMYVCICPISPHYDEKLRQGVSCLHMHVCVYVCMHACMYLRYIYIILYIYICIFNHDRDQGPLCMRFLTRVLCAWDFLRWDFLPGSFVHEISYQGPLHMRFLTRVLCAWDFLPGSFVHEISYQGPLCMKFLTRVLCAWDFLPGSLVTAVLRLVSARNRARSFLISLHKRTQQENWASAYGQKSHWAASWFPYTREHNRKTEHQQMVKKAIEQLLDFHTQKNPSNRKTEHQPWSEKPLGRALPVWAMLYYVVFGFLLLLVIFLYFGENVDSRYTCARYLFFCNYIPIYIYIYII
jgi:hypothetical protein